MVLREVIDFSDVLWIRAKLACEFLARFVFPFTQLLRSQIAYDFRQVRSRLSSDLKRDFNSLIGIHLADYFCSGQSFAVASGEFDAVCHCCLPRRGIISWAGQHYACKMDLSSKLLFLACGILRAQINPISVSLLT